MKLVNNNMESLTRRMIAHITDNIGWIFSKVAVQGVRNKQQINVSSDFPDAWTIDGTSYVVNPDDVTDIRRNGVPLEEISAKGWNRLAARRKPQETEEPAPGQLSHTTSHRRY